jgi:isopentenyl-diphosphate delta-isomerase
MDDIATRKSHHASICRDRDVQQGNPGWDRYRIEAASFPELAMSEVDTSATFLGKHLRLPFLIGCMTGGGGVETARVNRVLAAAAEKARVGLGLGSLRVAVEDPGALDEFKVRDLCPTVPLLGNISAWQLRDRAVAGRMKELVRELALDGVFVHVNAAHELCQPEGERNFKGALDAVCEFARTAKFPVLVKEVGFGLRASCVGRLVKAGVAGLDVAGAGGTSFERVEAVRTGSEGMAGVYAAMERPTVDALLDVREAMAAMHKVKKPPVLIASGGVRSFVHVAIALGLGADIVSAAHPVLLAASQGEQAVVDLISSWRDGLAAVMLLASCHRPAMLRKAVMDKSYVPPYIGDDDEDDPF